MMIREGIQKIVDGNNLTSDQSKQIMNEIMTGKATNAQTAAFLTSLRMKGESADELIAFASIMRTNCCTINPKVRGRLIDTCGTGGDKIKTFNVSTTAAFVIAGAGIAVAKHGNRAVTSESGSADVLEKLGLNLKMEPKQIERVIEKVGVGFMFAPIFHPAMKYAAEARKDIGIRTVFNVLGPMTNPACADAQLLGVYDHKMVATIAYALQQLGSKEAMVVYGLDGLDEISTIGKTLIAHLKNGKVTESEFTPEDFGIKKANLADLQASTLEENAEIIVKILMGDSTEKTKTDIVLLNSAAGIILGGKADNFNEAIQAAKESIQNGSAYAKLKELVEITGGNPQMLEEMEREG
jgi:anthranilate phosphoribosyltransferase